MPRDDSQFPMKVGVYAGLFCMPREYDLASSLFFLFVFLPLMAGIPIFGALYIFYDIYFRSHLMPTNGRGRLLARYFIRIIIVFMVWWLPVVLLSLVLTGFNPWVQYTIGALLAHSQGCASAMMTLMKPDVKEATRSFLRCCRPLRSDVVNQDMRRASSLRNRSTKNKFRSTMMRTWSSKRLKLSSWKQPVAPKRSGDPSGTQGSTTASQREMELAQEYLQQRSTWYEVSRLDMEEGIDMGNIVGEGEEKAENSAPTTQLQADIARRRSTWYELSELDMVEGINIGSEGEEDIGEAKTKENLSSDQEAGARNTRRRSTWFGQSSFGSEQRIDQEDEVSKNGNELEKDETQDLGSDLGSVHEV